MVYEHRFGGVGRNRRAEFGHVVVGDDDVLQPQLQFGIEIPDFGRLGPDHVPPQQQVSDQPAGGGIGGPLRLIDELVQFPDIVQHGGKLYVGCGSDHTERKVEGYNVTVSKQMCEKPLAPLLWAYDDVKPHWDKLVLRSYALERGERVLYQEGPVTAMRSPEELIKLYTNGRGLEDGTIMFCGTLAARGGVRPTGEFAFEFEDPVLTRKIAHAYRVRTLPNLG